MAFEKVNVVQVKSWTKDFEGKSSQVRTLVFEDGREFNVTEANKNYKSIGDKGLYTIAISDRNAKALSFIKREGDSKTETATTKKEEEKVEAKVESKPAAVYTARQPSEFDLARQKEIALEFYVGVAKDLCIAADANDPEWVFSKGVELYKKHRNFFNPNEYPKVDPEVERIMKDIPGTVVKEEEQLEIPV